jgi:prophage regulatory protein
MKRKRKPMPEPVPATMPDRLIRRADLPAYCGLQRSQIEYLVSIDEFPKPIKLSDSGRAIGWLASEVAAWQASRIKARGAS